MKDILRAGLPCALRSAQGDGPPTLHGHFAVFNRWTTIRSWFENDGEPFLERIAPGATARTIVEDRDQMRVMLQHGRDPLLGMKPIAVPDVLREDALGAYYEAPLLDGVPDLVIAGIRARQYGASFRFEVTHDDFVRAPERSEYNPDGLAERTIFEMRISEFGPVAWGAYPDATAGLRSLTDWYRNGLREAA